jgi:3-phenylpropionate/cinnamic acid dioxygenase small subunit
MDRIFGTLPCTRHAWPTFPQSQTKVEHSNCPMDNVECKRVRIKMVSSRMKFRLDFTSLFFSLSMPKAKYK